jgi:alpha-beta hydrolase superfamily lysophospholipase
MRQFRYAGRDGVEIVACQWDPPAPARAVVQLTHGMGEHVLRYHDLATTLTGHGFAVYGQDHRGHGASVGTAGTAGAELGQIGADGWGELVDDIGLLSDRIRADHPDLPLVLLGHSMGSFAVQQYLLDHSDRVSAAVLSGTAVIDLLEPALDLTAPLDLALFNLPFAPARTDYDWLSRDEAQVDAYVADPKCGFGLDAAATRAMFTAARAMADPARVAAMRTDLPVYIVVGDQDPVGGQLALVHALVARYDGLSDVTLKVYEGARHEVFNETNRAEVVADLLAWLNQHV